ncbi:MAG: type II toxin-antitoxin system PemK/MazF family toxin [Bacteroidales bacterium]
MDVRQYEIVLVNLDPTRGSEIRKTRPCVVLSPDEMNRPLQTVVIAPMTTRPRNYPTRVRVRLEGKAGWVVLDQIRTIDKQRILASLGNLNATEIRKVKSVLKETFVD